MSVRKLRDASRQAVRAPSDQFLSESELASQEGVVGGVRPRIRRPAGFLSDADAFVSEMSACATDRPAKLVVVEPLASGTTEFSSEQDDPADVLFEAVIHASTALPAVPSEATPPVAAKGHDLLARAVTASALSASFFVAVVLLTEALDWTHRAMFKSTTTIAAVQPSATLPIAAEPVAAVVTPIVEPTTPVPAPPSVDVALAPPIDPPEATPVPVVTSIAPAAVSAIERVDRGVELLPQELVARAAPVETVLLAAEPIRVETPAAPPATAVVSTVPDRVEPAPALAAVPSEADQIDGVLTRYRGAFNALDSAAARGVWPTVDERALDRAFARLQEQEVAFEHCDIDVAGARAAATCTGSARYVPKVGSRNQQTSSREWRFNLQKVEDRWVIEAVDAR